MKLKTSLIVGATGLTGKALLHNLLEADEYDKVMVLVRKPISISNEKLIQRVVDFDKLYVYKEQFIADDVFCCLGTTIKKAKTKEAFKKVDLQYPLEIARLTKENGARQFLVISAMGANPKSSVFYSQAKGLMESELQKIGFDTLHIFRPSMLLGNRDEFRLGEKVGIVLFKLLSWLFVGSLKKYKAIHTDVVAKAMYKAAQAEKIGVNIYPSDKIKLMF